MRTSGSTANGEGDGIVTLVLSIFFSNLLPMIKLGTTIKQSLNITHSK